MVQLTGAPMAATGMIPTLDSAAGGTMKTSTHSPCAAAAEVALMSATTLMVQLTLGAMAASGMTKVAHGYPTLVMRAEIMMILTSMQVFSVVLVVVEIEVPLLFFK